MAEGQEIPADTCWTVCGRFMSMRRNSRFLSGVVWEPTTATAADVTPRANAIDRWMLSRRRLSWTNRSCSLQTFNHRQLQLVWLGGRGTGLPGGGLSARRRCQCCSTSICRHSDLCHAPHVYHLRRPMLHSCRSTAMELAANQSKTMSQSGTIQAFVKDISV